MSALGTPCPLGGRRACVRETLAEALGWDARGNVGLRTGAATVGEANPQD